MFVVSSTLLFAIATGGAIGAIARYLLSSFIMLYIKNTSFPWGTIAVNLTGALLIGIFYNLAWSNDTTRLFWTIGILGGFTTFSSFSLETILLIEKGLWVQACLYTILLPIGCSLMTLLAIFIFKQFPSS